MSEGVRWVLAAADVAWEFKEIATHEDLLAVKASGETLFGQVPVLKYADGSFVLSQVCVLCE